MNILILGDIMGSSGREAIIKKLPGLISKKKIDFVIVNGENAADSGVGITKSISEEFFTTEVIVTDVYLPLLDFFSAILTKVSKSLCVFVVTFESYWNDVRESFGCKDITFTSLKDFASKVRSLVMVSKVGELSRSSISTSVFSQLMKLSF